MDSKGKANNIVEEKIFLNYSGNMKMTVFMRMTQIMHTLVKKIIYNLYIHTFKNVGDIWMQVLAHHLKLRQKNI